MFSRTDERVIARWWWTVDKVLLGAVLALILGGLVLSLAASPPVADRLGLDSFHFVKRHAIFVVPAVALMIGVSLMDPRQIRRSALVVFIAGLCLMVLALQFGAEVKGARRWISIAGFVLQPSEFVKPAFVVLVAWAFSERIKRPDMPGNMLAVLMLAAFVGLLVPQPDFGQTMLAVLVWGALFFAAGMSWLWIIALGGLGVGGIAAAYAMVPHVRERIDRFLDPESGDTFQIDTAIESFVRGGWLGRGPGEGTVKQSLPDSHTDFIFAVTAEEFGIVVCLILVAAFAFVVLRGLAHALRERDPFLRLSVTGLIVLFGLQSAINMAVNLHLMPAKGMTLPFISYGGSSILSLAYGMGMVLGLTRRRPQTKPVLTELTGPVGVPAE
ncbi:putative lipid II flippase FtsW [Microbaculum marinum]|uniref:Probable peptidoglycan glycosyltransferase FtsW n=1 Tax=Microbaculum marinum TaxID=1764581 RepID=A0AAW9RWC9_9HYPH